MSADDFEAWMTSMRRGQPFSERSAAKALGVSRRTVRAYRTGESAVPRHIGLACTAVSMGWPEWKRAA